MSGVLVAVKGVVTYEPGGVPPEGFVLTRDGVWRHPDALDAETLLWTVRTILRVPEGESLTQWATRLMARVERQDAGPSP